MAAYFVKTGGSDAADGLSDGTAWATIAKVNSTVLQAGDIVRFAGGNTFTGRLELFATDLGIAANPVTVESYGTGKATLSNASNHGIYIYNTNGVTVRDLVVQGSGFATSSHVGIYIYTDSTGAAKKTGIRVESNVEIKGWKTGIEIVGFASDSSASGWDGVTIADAWIHDCRSMGIFAWGREVSGQLCHANITVERTVVHDISGATALAGEKIFGDGILLSNVDGALVDQCVTHTLGHRLTGGTGGPVGQWCYRANAVIFRRGESYNNTTVTGADDGGGFGLDVGTTDSLVERCYSHGNAGAGMLMAHPATVGRRAYTGNVIRYCISENDGRQNSYGGVVVWNETAAEITDCSVYHNTIYLAGPATSGVPNGIGVWAITTRLSILNNVIITTGGLRQIDIVTGQVGMDLRGNAYWSALALRYGATTYSDMAAFRTATGFETGTGVFADPLLSSMGNGGTFGNATLLETMTAYRPLPGSPLINTGVPISSRGSLDFFGGALYSADIGAGQKPMTSPSLNPVDIHDYRGHIPDSMLVAYDRIRAAEDARYEHVHTTRWAARQPITTDFGAGAIVLGAVGLDQTARMQAAINASAAGNFPIDATGIANFVEIGTAASRIHEFVLAVGAVSVAANSPSSNNTSTVTVQHTANGIVLPEQVYLSPNAGEVERAPALVGGLDLCNMFDITQVSANSYQCQITGRAAPSPSTNAMPLFATYRKPFVSLVPTPGAMLVMGPEFKLWRKGGNNTGPEAGNGSYLFKAGAHANGFWLEGGQSGNFGDSHFHRGGHALNCPGDGVFIRDHLIDHGHGIQAVQGGNDSCIRGLRSINTDPEAGGGLRIGSSATGYLCEDCDLLTSDDAMMNSGSGADGLDVMFVNCNAVAQQGAVFVSIFSQKGAAPTGANAFVTAEGRTVWNRTLRTLWAGCSGRSGNQGLAGSQVQGGYAGKLINGNCREVSAYIAGSPIDRSRDLTGRALNIVPIRGPVHVRLIESPVRQPLQQAISQSVGTDISSNLPSYDSTGSLTLINSDCDAPRTPGVPTIRLLGCTLFRAVNSTIGSNDGHAIEASSSIGTTERIILSGVRAPDLRTKRSAVNARLVTEVRERGCKFVAAAGATSVSAVRRATVDTEVMGGTARRNVYSGTQEIITGHDYANDETDLLVRRFSEVPSQSELDLIDATMTLLKAAAGYPLLDFFYLLGAGSRQAATQNWIANTFNCAEVGVTIEGEGDIEDVFEGPEFVPARGFRAGSGAKYLATRFIPAVQSPLGSKWQQNSAMMAVWAGEDVTGGTAGEEIIAPQAHGAYIHVERTNGETRARLNDTTNSTFAGPADPTGLWIVRRAGPSSISVRHDTTNVGTAAVASTGLGGSGVRICQGARLVQAAWGGAYHGDDTSDELRLVAKNYIDGMAVLFP